MPTWGNTWNCAKSSSHFARMLTTFKQKRKDAKDPTLRASAARKEALLPVNGQNASVLLHKVVAFCDLFLLHPPRLSVHQDRSNIHDALVATKSAAEAFNERSATPKWYNQVASFLDFPSAAHRTSQVDVMGQPKPSALEQLCAFEGIRALSHIGAELH